MTVSTLVCLLAAVFIAGSSAWPEIYSFAVDPEIPFFTRLLGTPIHLHDDVMVSLRSGHILNETGIPAFNRHDLAQPSTSYLSPYLFAALLKVFPENISVGAYALLGLAAVAVTLGMLVLFSRALANAVLLVAALILTKTNSEFALTGWDHLFQGLFLTFSTCIALSPRAKHPASLVVASVSLAMGALFRPDGILIAFSILMALYFSCGSIRLFGFFGLFPSLLIVIIALTGNYAQFGHLTPTTARLKVCASPSFEYAVKYFIDNSLLSYTALTLLMFLITLYFTHVDSKANSIIRSIVIGCTVTAVIAAVNSDAFQAARMFWTPACVMAAVISSSAPPLILFTKPIASGPIELSFSRTSRLLLAIACAVVGINLLAAIPAKCKNAIVSPSRILASPSAQQFVIAKWIDSHLDPADGAIGCFFLGVSYHLPRFEIADFLGKADELIATSPVKWGPPGHNKWNIDATLQKWKIQAIIPADNSDASIEGKLQHARKSLTRKTDFGFAPDLLLHFALNEKFDYCYVPSPRPGVDDKWGFYLRRDIAQKYYHQLRK